MTTTNDIGTMISRLTERQQQEFALACARRVQHLMRDPRSVAVLEVRERWLRGEATDEEMKAALAAAWDAAWDAAAAALAAADAAWDAEDAALDAAAAAQAASYDAERAWQREQLERMLRGDKQ